MNGIKTITFALAATAGLPALAQSNVTLYGRMDLAVETVRFSGAPTGSRSVSQVTNDGSRFGVRGTEDLGGGLRALFNLEAAVSADTGLTGNPFWGRQCWMGLGSAAMGDVLLGRNYSPMDDDAWYFDAFQYAGNAAAYQIQKYTARINNSVKYISPKFGGAQIRLLYGLAENDSKSPPVGRTYSANIGYFSGPVAAKAAVQKMVMAGSAPGTTFDRRDTYVGASYDFRVLRTSLVYFNRKDTGVADYTSLIGGVNIPVGSNGDDVRANFGRVKQGSMKSSTFGIGYWHPMSKRTFVYAAYNHNHNDGGSNLINFQMPSYAAIGSGESTNAFQVGMRHNF